jgi:hypothetical protein
VFDPAEDALLVDDEDRTVRAAQFLIKDTVLSRYLAVRPKVRDEGVRDATKRFAPCLLGLDWIAADSQNLAIYLLKLIALRVVGRYLLVSGRGESKRVKGEHDIFASTILAQLNFHTLHFGFGNDAWCRKIGSGVASF